MPSFSASKAARILTHQTFHQLCNLVQQMSQVIEDEETATVLTEDICSSIPGAADSPKDKFCVLVSERFSILVQGQEIPVAGETWQTTALPDYAVNLTFDPAAIADFLTELSQIFQDHPPTLRSLDALSQTLKPNDVILQNEFTLRLIEVLSSGANQPEVMPVQPIGSVCAPVEAALRQQVEQERLLNQVSTQIRQSLELPVILETAVQQVRHFLQLDRLVIFQFSSVTSPNLHPTEAYGSITYEARATDSIPSILHWAEAEDCFISIPDCYEKYRKGLILAVNNVEQTYPLSPCLLQLMRQTQVKAKLVVPIVVQEKIWGLLIGHNCFEPRQWQEGEKTFLHQIAEHLEIAIYQAQLYAQLQQQKQTLEQRVIERTQELHDAMLTAQAANRSKGEFLALMSHELRTPLTCIIGMSATLLRWSFGHMSQRQQHYLQMIHDSGNHLMALINDILDMSQVEAGKTVLNISEFSLTKLAYQSLQSLQEKNQSLLVEVEADIQIVPEQDTFTADQRRVQQIVLNLLSNAVKFTPEGGRVTLRIWVEGNTAVFQVEDTGIGIEEYQRSLIFQKFQQLDPTYNRKYEGTGLGLALTKQLVELHRGWIEVDSTVGVGSIFTVRLPAQPLALSDGVATVPAHPSNLQGRIVLIEEQEESAMLICDLLTAANYQVVWMVEGSTAVKQIEIIQPLAIITAIQLPGMDGYEVIRQLRNSPVTQNLKIVALNSKTTEAAYARCLEAGADDCITKPIQPEQFLDKVIALLDTQAENLTTSHHT